MPCRLKLIFWGSSITLSLLACYQEKPSSVAHQLSSQKDSLEQNTNKMLATLYYNTPYIFKTIIGKTTTITLKDNHTYTKNTYGYLENDAEREEKGRWEIKGRTLQLRDQLNTITTYSIGERYLQIQDVQDVKENSSKKDSIVRYELTN